MSLSSFIDLLLPYGTLGYLLIFSVLLACGFGLPMPEDIILVTGGILASRGVLDFHLALAVSFVGVILGDGIIFCMGRYMGPKLKEKAFFKRAISPERERKILSWFARYGDKVIFIARFTPGLRMPLFLSSGLYKVAPWKFFALDGLAALISVPIWVKLGHLFGQNLPMLEEKMHSMQKGFLLFLAVILILFVGFFVLKHKLSKKIS